MTGFAPPFQYATRARQLESISEERRTALMEDRDQELEDFLSRLVTYYSPAGMISFTVSTVQPDGWLFDNQSVANADLVAPGLWAVAPAAWKSGTTLNIPDLTNRVLMIHSTPGTLGGAMSRTIGSNNLPTHTHPVSIQSGGESQGHVHYLNQSQGVVRGWQSTASTSGITANHTHYYEHGYQEPGAQGVVGVGAPWYLYNAGYNTGTVSSDHGHVVQGYTSGSHQDHSHLVSGNTSNNSTTGTALDTTPAHMTVRAIVKT